MRREPAPRKLPDIITTTAVAAVCATSIASAAGTFTNGWHRRFSRKLGVWQSFRKCSRGLYRYCKRERGRWHLARRVTGGMRHNAYAEEGKEIPDFDPLEHMVRQLPATVRATMDAAPGGSMLILDLRGELPELEIMAPNSLALEHQQDAWHGHSSHEGMLPAEMSGWGMMEHESHVPFHEFSGHAETALTAHGLDAEMSPHCMHFHGHHEEHHHHHTHHDHVHAEEPHAFHVFFSTVLRIPGLDPYAVCTGGHHHGHHHHHASHHDHSHHSHHELHHHLHRHEHHWHGHHHVPHEHWHHSHHGYHEHGHHGHHHLHHHSRHSHHEHGHHAHHWHGHVHVPHGHQHIHHSHHGHYEHGHHGHHHLHHHHVHHEGHGHHHAPGHNTAKHVRHEQAQWSLRFFDAVWGKKVGIDPTAIAKSAASKAEAAAIYEASKPPKVSNYHVLGRRERRLVYPKVISAADAQPPQ